MFKSIMAQSAGTVECTDSFSAKELDSRNDCPGYDTKQSDGQAPVMLKLWGMQSISLLPLLPGLLWPGLVAPDMVISIGLNRIKLCAYAKLNCLK